MKETAEKQADSGGASRPIRADGRETGVRRFSMSGQKAFAALSGDANPVHLDPVAARRTLFGRPIVHGIHALLWALETWADEKEGQFKLSRLKADFPAPIPVGSEAVCRVIDEAGFQTRMAVAVGVFDVLRVAIDTAAGAETQAIPPGPAENAPAVIKSPAASDMKDACGSMPLHLDRDLATSLFPDLSRSLPATQVAVILAVSRLVGMECPGLNSVLSGLDLTFDPKPGASDWRLSYRVARFDAVLSHARIEIIAPGVDGHVSAFLRPPPQSQASCATLAPLVGKDEFRLQKALIVGGSRGLGEVAAKLLAVGGADVRLTFHSGRRDARNVVKEIGQAGGNAECFRLNVLKKTSDDLKVGLGTDWLPTHLYYFATPFIFAGRKGVFSPQLFAEFCDYYVRGFSLVIGRLTELGVGALGVLCPSSTAVEELPLDMAEYALAKAVAESLCESMRTKMPGITIVAPRFPRIATDQTAGLFPVERKDPVSLVLDALRQLAGEQR